ncbi:MAG: PAS domain S-box protein [Leptolyngbya sp. SIO3F4]|nr:PAS domain S-box protein [Leptolyngbya sp. SIO3F4]
MPAVIPKGASQHETRQASMESLYLTAKILMTPLTVSKQTSLSEVIALMSRERQICNLTCSVASNTANIGTSDDHSLDQASLELSCAIIVEDDKPIGIFTERDLVCLAAQGKVITHKTIETVMTSPLITISQDKASNLFVAVDLLQQYRVRHLPVVDNDGKLVGILTRESIRQSLKPSDLLRLHNAAATMTRNVIQAARTSSLQSIAQLMAQHRISCVVITETIEDKTFPIGIVTEGDIVQLQTLSLDFTMLTAQSVMSHPVFCASPKLNLWQAHQLMAERRITHLVITNEDNSLAGILTQTTILKSLNPGEMVEVIGLLQKQIDRLETEKLQLLKSRNSKLQEAVNHEIATHQKTELRLRESEQRYASLAAIVPVVIFQANLSGECTYINKRWTDLTGISQQATLGQGWVQGIYPHDQEQVVAVWQQSVQTSQPFQQEFRLLLSDGSTRWVYAQAQPEWDSATREISGYVGSLTDISDRKATEFRLQETELKFRSTFEQAAVGMTMAAPDGSFIQVNQKICDLLGYTVDELMGLHPSLLRHPSYRKTAVHNIQQLLKGKIDSFGGDELFLKKDTTPIWLNTRITLVRDEVGQPLYMMGVAQDVSDRKRAEIALRDSEQRFRRAIAEAPVPIMIHAEDGEILQISSTWTELTGYTHIDLPTTQAWTTKAYEPEAARTVDQIISQEYTLESRCEEGDFTVTTCNGQKRIWSFSSASLGKLPDGRRIAISMAADITEKQKAQNALQTSENRYRALVEVIPDLLIRQDAEGNYLDLVMSNEVRFVQPDLAHIGINIYDLLPLELAQQRMEYVHRALNTGEIQLYDFEIDIGGKLRWQEARIIAINQSEVLVIVRDISQRKQAENQLQETSQRLQDAQQIAHLGNWELNLQTNNLYWSDEIFHIFEIDQTQFGASYEAFIEAIYPDDRAMVNQAYKQHIQDSIPYSIVHRLLMPDGRIKYVQEQCETTQDSEGKALLSRGTVLDITSLKEEEYKRQQAETSLRQVVEGTAAVIEHDFFQELVQHISTALDVRYTSISEAKSDGFSVLAFCIDGHLQTVDRCLYEQFPCCTQALEQGQCYHPESLLTLYPENELFKSLNAQSYLGIGLRNSEGKSIGNLCVMHDRPLQNPEWMINLLKIFGARAGAELERYQTARQLQALTNELEQRVSERTAALATTVENLQTEIKRRQALSDLLLQSQEQLQDIFDSANDMIQSVALADGSFEFVNRAWLETLGYTAQDIEHLNMFDVLHPSCQIRCRTLMQRLQMGQLQSLDQLELSFVAKDGRVIEVEGNVNCHMVDGEPVYTRGIFRDISERKKSETKLYNLSTRLSLAVKSGSIGIWEWDFINEKLTWDERMYELYGTPPEKFTGHFTDWANRVHPDDFASTQEQFQQAIDQQKELDIEFRVIHPNGHMLYIKANGLIERNIDGKPLRMIGINIDISDRKKAETEIIKTLEQERELNEMKSRFVSNTSHEFRTPLTVISNNAELLKLFGDKLGKAEQQKCLETILSYVDHATELIDEVLIVSRAESGKITIKPEPLNVVEFSQQLIQTIGFNTHNHQLEFVMQDARVQTGRHNHRTQLDRKILQQSLTNLLTNAIKYSPEGSSIIFQLTLTQENVEFQVIDQGIGIPEEDQKYLFEPFHRATNVGTTEGTGLGLSIVKRLITLHQGNINVKSTLGEGSCFTVTIPTEWQEVDQ